ncbi:MAG: hypothetical protein ACE5G8_02305, partial [Anaerolineae bacterium]
PAYNFWWRLFFLMPQSAGARKESEVQATTDPIPAELDSPIAPQGYQADFVTDIANLENPAQKRAGAIRLLLFGLLMVALVLWPCPIPNPQELPGDAPIPYGIERRPLPPTDLFLEQIAPKSLGEYRLVNQTVQRVFEEPFVGATVAVATYTNPNGGVATVWIINAESYINAKRYMKGLKAFLQSQKNAAVVDYIWQEHNFIEWEAPELANRAYGFAWSNRHFYYSVTSASKEVTHFFAQNFPY